MRDVLVFLGDVALCTLQLALLIGTLAGLFLLLCFALGWLAEAIKRLR